MDYISKSRKTVSFKARSGKYPQLRIKDFRRAIKATHAKLDIIQEAGVNVIRLLGMRNASAFLGELFAESLIKCTSKRFVTNPHQDGYPDLLYMDSSGREQYKRLKKEGKLGNKKPFSPFKNGGLEIKATCGGVPTPERCKKLGLKGKPNLGDQRISVLTGYDWKSHHRETKNLVGLLWDFIKRKPRIVAVFLSSELNATDWSKIVQPKTGGGRTTSVSIMNSKGVYKMYKGWVLVYEDDARYARAINEINGCSAIPTSS